MNRVSSGSEACRNNFSVVIQTLRQIIKSFQVILYNLFRPHLRGIDGMSSLLISQLRKFPVFSALDDARTMTDTVCLHR
jgi:hypothetical protein